MKLLPYTKLLEKDPCSPNYFKRAVIAHNIAAVKSINSLVAQGSYKNNIQILDHQTKTALHVLNNFSHRALLADEVGLGKTIEAGIIIKEYIARKLSTKILILTPATLALQWQEELRSKFGEDFTIPESPEAVKDIDKVLISIDTAKTERYAKVMKEIYWDLLIVDEAHKLKNKATLNYKFVKSLQKERFLMLTATPLQNNIFELWALLDLLHPGFLGTETQFSNNYVADKDGLKVVNKEELHEKLSKIMVRNLRRETNIKFVDRIVKTLFLNYSPEELKYYNDAIQFIKKRYDEIKRELPEKTEEMSKEELKKVADMYRRRGLLTFSLIMLTRQIASSIRTGTEALKKYRETIEDDVQARLLDDLIMRGQSLGLDKKIDETLKIIKKEKSKVIIFTSFLHTQKMLELELNLNGISSVIFNGTMNPQEKEAAIKQFKEESQVLICTDAGSEGRNLQFAHVLINYDLPWNPMRIEQRIGRVHRIGQTKDVKIYNLAINDTVEAYILNRLYEKIDLFHVSIGEMDMILTNLKSKNFEEDFFESYLKGDEKPLETDLKQSKKSLEKTKSFDDEVFDES